MLHSLHAPGGAHHDDLLAPGRPDDLLPSPRPAPVSVYLAPGSSAKEVMAWLLIRLSRLRSCSAMGMLVPRMAKYAMMNKKM